MNNHLGPILQKALHEKELARQKTAGEEFDKLCDKVGNQFPTRLHHGVSREEFIQIAEVREGLMTLITLQKESYRKCADKFYSQLYEELQNLAYGLSDRQTRLWKEESRQKLSGKAFEKLCEEILDKELWEFPTSLTHDQYKQIKAEKK